MYSTLSEFKTYLGISGNDKDTELSSILNSANALLNKILGVDYTEHTVEENCRYITEGDYGICFYLKEGPVKSITEINSKSFDYEEGITYQIQNGRKLIIKDRTVLSDFGRFGDVKIKYISGYSVIPEDLKFAEMIIAGGTYNSKGNENISSYRLGDETINYGKVSGVSELDYTNTIKQLEGIINKYKLVYIAK